MTVWWQDFIDIEYFILEILKWLSWTLIFCVFLLLLLLVFDILIGFHQVIFAVMNWILGSFKVLLNDFDISLTFVFRLYQYIRVIDEYLFLSIVFIFHWLLEKIEVRRCYLLIAWIDLALMLQLLNWKDLFFGLALCQRNLLTFWSDKLVDETFLILVRHSFHWN